MGRFDTHKQLLALWTALDGGPKPRCRDCADYNGRCPSDNLPCEPQDRALEQIANLRRIAAKTGDEVVTAQSVMDSRNRQFGFAWDLNEAICDAIDAGKTESRDIAARVTTNPKIKEWLKLLPPSTAAKPKP